MLVLFSCVQQGHRCEQLDVLFLVPVECGVMHYHVVTLDGTRPLVVGRMTFYTSSPQSGEGKTVTERVKHIGRTCADCAGYFHLLNVGKHSEIRVRYQAELNERWLSFWYTITIVW